MTRFVLAVFLSTISFEASAIVRYMVQGMTCAEVQEAMNRDGVAILYRQTESGAPLYDRFVRDGSFCATGTTAARQRISVADTSDCRVTRCIDRSRFGD